MIVYKEGTVTQRLQTSVDTLSYYGYVAGIDSDDLVKDGLNHIYVTGSGFCKILFVVNGTAYVSAPTKYSSGTLVREAGSDTEQKITITESLSLANA
jgi:hypothetical protein